MERVGRQGNLPQGPGKVLFQVSHSNEIINILSTSYMPSAVLRPHELSHWTLVEVSQDSHLVALRGWCSFFCPFPKEGKENPSGYRPWEATHSLASLKYGLV
jgi:hypothetical protein